MVEESLKVLSREGAITIDRIANSKYIAGLNLGSILKEHSHLKPKQEFALQVPSMICT